MFIDILTLVAASAYLEWNPRAFEINVGFFRPGPPNIVMIDTEIFPGVPDVEGLTLATRQIRKQLFSWVPSQYCQMHVYHDGFPVCLRFLYRSQRIYPKHGIARYELGWRVFGL